MKKEFDELKRLIDKQDKLLLEAKNLLEKKENEKRTSILRLIDLEINEIKRNFKDINTNIRKVVEGMSLGKGRQNQKKEIKKEIKDGEDLRKFKKELGINLSVLKEIYKQDRIKKERKTKKPSSYVKIANKLFLNISRELHNKKLFESLEKDLLKANINIMPTSYISVILFTTLISFFIALGIFLFFLFFGIGQAPEYIVILKEGYAKRAVGLLWILFLVPVITFISLYFYPSAEKKALEARINNELPFAAINMSAIAGSMLEPTKIFQIIVNTGEYEYIEKEFKKLLNLINVYGYDLVTALKITASNTASQKLSELFNGLATTISSGGNLREFFSRRADTLLFDYRIEREKHTKAAETFMDIYISVVIAAPMMLMLLLITIQISNLGLNITPLALSLLMVLGVSVVNILFLAFLHLKQPEGG